VVLIEVLEVGGTGTFWADVGGGMVDLTCQEFVDHQGCFGLFWEHNGKCTLLQTHAVHMGITSTWHVKRVPSPR